MLHFAASQQKDSWADSFRFCHVFVCRYTIWLDHKCMKCMWNGTFIFTVVREVWLRLKAQTVFIQENGPAYCSLGNELLNQALHSRHHMWKELDWSWGTPQMENKQCECTRTGFLRLLEAGAWLFAAWQSVVYTTWMLHVMCAGCKKLRAVTVNPLFSCGKNDNDAGESKNEHSPDFFIDYFPVWLCGRCFFFIPFLSSQTNMFLIPHPQTKLMDRTLSAPLSLCGCSALVVRPWNPQMVMIVI